MTLLQAIENGFLLLGGLLGAVILVQLFWGLVGYVFYGGDDQHRSHAKVTILNATINIVLLALVWWIFELIAGAIGS